LKTGKTSTRKYASTRSHQRLRLPAAASAASTCALRRGVAHPSASRSTLKASSVAGGAESCCSGQVSGVSRGALVTVSGRGGCRVELMISHEPVRPCSRTLSVPSSAPAKTVSSHSTSNRQKNSSMRVTTLASDLPNSLESCTTFDALSTSRLTSRRKVQRSVAVRRRVHCLPACANACSCASLAASRPIDSRHANCAARLTFVRNSTRPNLSSYVWSVSSA